MFVQIMQNLKKYLSHHLYYLSFTYIIFLVTIVSQAEEGNIKLDHDLNITLPSFSPSLERSFNRALGSFERACRDISRSLTVVGYGIAAYLVMSGISRLIEARNARSLPAPDNSD